MALTVVDLSYRRSDHHKSQEVTDHDDDRHRMKSRHLVLLLGIVLGWSNSVFGSILCGDDEDGANDPSKPGSCDNIQDERVGKDVHRPAGVRRHDDDVVVVPTNEIANRTAASSQAQPCSLFMAPSGVEGAGFGMYTACAPRNGDVVRSALTVNSDKEDIVPMKSSAD
jgi:hypothetical protein